MLPIDKLEALERRFLTLDQLMCDSAVLADPRELRTLNKERVDI